MARSPRSSQGYGFLTSGVADMKGTELKPCNFLMSQVYVCLSATQPSQYNLNVNQISAAEYQSNTKIIAHKN